MQPDASAAAELTQLLPRGRPIFGSFSGDPDREYYVYVPASAGQNPSMAVLIHGISCNAAEQILRFVDEAELRGMVLIAPLFERTKYGKYQQVVDRQTGIRSDLALLEIVERVAKQSGADNSKFNLFGFSGGSQFAHRFAMLHPDRVASCVCASAGWYTFPDGARGYPQGIGSHPLDGGCFDPVAIGSVPIHVLVGERDIAQIHPSGPVVDLCGVRAKPGSNGRSAGTGPCNNGRYIQPAHCPSFPRPGTALVLQRRGAVLRRSCSSASTSLNRTPSSAKS